MGSPSKLLIALLISLALLGVPAEALGAAVFVSLREIKP
jgi:hypothetical protein